MRLVQKKSPTGLITCSICLRVHRGSEWTEAERVIREIRSYELDAPPRLQSASVRGVRGIDLQPPSASQGARRRLNRLRRPGHGLSRFQTLGSG